MSQRRQYLLLITKHNERINLTLQCALIAIKRSFLCGETNSFLTLSVKMPKQFTKATGRVIENLGRTWHWIPLMLLWKGNYLEKHSLALPQLVGFEVRTCQVEQQFCIAALVELANAILVLGGIDKPQLSRRKDMLEALAYVLVR